jgi:tetratricopeptide (TPR) repeat protein
MTSPPSNSNLSLPAAVERYAAAISTLESAGVGISADAILEVLAARAQVHDALKRIPRLPQSGLLGMLQILITGKPGINYRRLIRTVNLLDNRLMQQEELIKQAVKIEHWRNLLPQPEREWLQLFDSPRWRDRYDWLWQGLSLACLTASLSLLTDISARFLEGGPDAAGVFAIIVPAVLALLTGGGALTTTGRQAIENILTSLRIAKHWWDEVICLASVLLLGFLLAFWLSLPLIANLYEYLGDMSYCANQSLPPITTATTTAEESPTCQLQIARAERRYIRAIKLNPNDGEAHYKLGRLYEDLQDNEQAIAEYQVAIKGDIATGSYRAYERLTRLYILQGEFDRENYSKAIALSIRGVQLLSLEKEKTAEMGQSIYALHKNRGWAYLQQNSYLTAVDSLDEAIKISKDEAAAYCLLAQARDKLGELQSAKAAWEQCVAFADLSDPDEATWYGLARRRLREQTEAKQQR